MTNLSTRAEQAKPEEARAEIWEHQPGAREFVDGVRRIDAKLADAILIALRAGYTLEQVKDVCRAGQHMAKGPTQ